MYYKTKKESATGKRFQAYLIKNEECRAAIVDLAKKHGFSAWRLFDLYLNGYIASVIFDKTPDTKLWLRVANSENEYRPSKRTKAGKLIYQEFENLPKITRDDLNNCIGWTVGPILCPHIGFFEGADFFFFSTKREWAVTIPDDCIEILESEYFSQNQNN